MEVVQAAPRAQPPPPRWEARAVCLQEEATNQMHRSGSKEKTGYSETLEIKGSGPYGQYETYGLTAQEIKEEARRRKNLSDRDVQNQCDLGCL